MLDLIFQIMSLFIRCRGPELVIEIIEIIEIYISTFLKIADPQRHSAIVIIHFNCKNEAGVSF